MLNDRILAQQLENLKMERAHEEGEKAGAKEKSLKIAKEMIKKGFDIKNIAEITGLEESEVIELKD